MSRRLASALIGAVLAVALLAGVTVWALQARGDLSREDDLLEARQEALSTATEVVPALLTYTGGDLDTQLAAARDLLTERFRPEFEELQRTLIAPAVRQRGFSTTATLERIGVVSESTGEVTLLVMLSQTTTGPQQQDAEPIATRATVRLRDVDGTWLVDALTPV